MVFDDAQTLREYGIEVDASVADIHDLERDVNLILSFLATRGSTSQTSFIASTGYEVPINLKQLRIWLSQRASLVGKLLIPYFLELLGISPNRFIVAYNGKLLEQIPLVFLPNEHYPVRELFPDYFTNRD